MNTSNSKLLDAFWIKWSIRRILIGIAVMNIFFSCILIAASLIFNNLLMVMIIAAPMFILMIAVAMASSRWMLSQTEQIAYAINELSHGKIKYRIPISSRGGELDIIAASINAMAENMTGTLNTVSNVTENITHNSAEISAAVEEQSIVSSEQSASVSEITATMEELSISSSQIAEHAERVLEMSSKALQETTSGAESVEMVMSKMSEITEDNHQSTEEILQVGKKSKDIAKVINIINNIADQTKLIAFNAALEASSAGEAGRRFGVVAVEIRRLADTVMESIKEIETHISENQEAINRLIIRSEEGGKRVQDGMDLVTQTAEMLIGIVDDVRSTAEASKQISFSTQQQKTASDQVLISLKEIGHGIQQSSTSIHQIHAIMKKVNSLSELLHNEMEHFDLKGDKR